MRMNYSNLSGFSTRSFFQKNSQPGVNEIFAFLFVKEKKEIKVKLWLKLLVFHAQFTFWR